MIIKGTEHNNARNLARYLLRAKENETCRLWELRDSASDKLAKSLTDWEMIGRCKTKGSKILYHAHIRICDDERIHEARWHETIAKLEERLGFTNCPRAIVGHEHEQKGLHIHIVWSRYDPQRSALVKLGNDHQQHHSVARDAEREYGLRPAVEPAKDNKTKKRRLSDRDVQAIKERGGNREQLTKLVRAAWAATDSGEEMRAMLKSLKIELVPGDRRDWVVYYKGLKLNPVRLLPEVKTAAFRKRMQDVNLEDEKQKQREAETIKKTFRRKAKDLMKEKVDAAMESAPSTRKGFRKIGRKAPQPTLRRKLRYEDPGSRRSFEAETKVLLDGTIARVKTVISTIKDQNLLPRRVYLVGGSTRMPAVSKALEELLSKLLPHKVEVILRDPDLAVAKGAAFHGFITRLKEVVKENNGDFSSIATLYPLTEPYIKASPVSTVLSRALGYKILRNKKYEIDHLVFHNDQLPISRETTYATITNNQNVVTLGVYEQAGEVLSSDPEHNKRIGEIVLSNLRSFGLPEGSPLTATLRVESNGTVNVSATEAVSGKSVSATLTIDGAPSAEEITAVTTELTGLRINRD